MLDSTVGVDISKTHLDVHVVPAGKAGRFPNVVELEKVIISGVPSTGLR